MNNEEFISEISEILQTDEKLTFETELETLDGWDSLARITLMVFLQNNFDKQVTLTELNALKTIEDIAKKAGIC